MSQERPTTEAELVDFVRALDVRAPASLHASVQTLIGEHSRRRTPAARAAELLLRGFGSAPRLAGAGGVLAALVLVGVLALTGGSGAGGPSLRQAAALTLLPATAGAPAESHAHNASLVAAVDGVSFPYWERDLGWRSTGERTDRLGGRAVMTVFYADRQGRELGYAIVAGSAPHLSGGEVTQHGGTSYRLLSENGARVVTWLRAGHMCVVSGRGVDATTLLRLASWHESAPA
jgi:hypothetical protein